MLFYPFRDLRRSFLPSPSSCPDSKVTATMEEEEEEGRKARHAPAFPDATTQGPHVHKRFVWCVFKLDRAF